MNDYLKDIFKTQFTFQVVVLGTIFMIVSIFTLKEFFIYLSFMFLFTGFDCVGYGNQINRTQRWNDETVLKPYRIMQSMFHVIIFIAIWLYAGWICLLASFLGWWMGGCDFLFYIVLKERLQKDDYFWMKGWSVWLVLTPIKRLIFKTEYIGRIEFTIICSLGLILWTAIISMR